MDHPGIQALEQELKKLRAENKELRELLDSAADMLRECGLRDKIYKVLECKNSVEKEKI